MAEKASHHVWHWHRQNSQQHRPNGHPEPQRHGLRQAVSSLRTMSTQVSTLKQQRQYEDQRSAKTDALRRLHMDCKLDLFMGRDARIGKGPLAKGVVEVKDLNALESTCKGA